MSSTPHRPEHWRSDAGTADVATLTIPPDGLRERRFEVFCRFVVSARSSGATHGMRVDVNGTLEWQRREPTQNPGSTDSMELRFAREVPAGQAVRIRVKTQVERAQRVRLTIEAEEQ